MNQDRPFDDLMAALTSASPAGAFRPCAWYNADGDAWEIYLSPEPHLAERVDALFTVLVSEADRDKVVGVVIKNIRKHFGPAGLTEVLCKVERATVRLLVQGALFAQEFSLIRQTSNRPPSGLAGDARVQEIIAQVGDIEVELQNREALVGA